MLFVLSLQNQDKKTRTSVYVMIVNEVLDDWDDAKCMGKSIIMYCHWVSPEAE